MHSTVSTLYSQLLKKVQKIVYVHRRQMRTDPSPVAMETIVNFTACVHDVKTLVL